MDDRLLRRRQREARASDRAVTSLLTLPPELLASVMEYASYKWRYSFQRERSWLGSLLTIACANRACLEALRYIPALRIEFEDHIPVRNRVFDDQQNSKVARWCDIVGRRFRHVLSAGDPSVAERNTMNPTQTNAILDCLASFPNLQSLHLRAGDAIAACASLKGHFLAGRFPQLRSLRLRCYYNSDLRFQRDHEPTAAGARQLVKSAVRDFMSDVPVDRAVDVLVCGVFPHLLNIDDEWGLWTSTLFDLLAKGADVHSRPMLLEVVGACLKNFDYMEDMWIRGHMGKLTTFYDTVEKLLVVHGVDANYRGRWSYDAVDHVWLINAGHRASSTVVSVLWLILYWLSWCFEKLTGEMELPGGDGAPWDSEAEGDMQEVVQLLMRTMDLLVRHGARCSKDDCPKPNYKQGKFEEDNEYVERLADTYRTTQNFSAWVLAHPSCTAAVREAANRGNLVLRDIDNPILRAAAAARDRIAALSSE